MRFPTTRIYWIGARPLRVALSAFAPNAPYRDAINHSIRSAIQTNPSAAFDSQEHPEQVLDLGCGVRCVRIVAS